MNEKKTSFESLDPEHQEWWSKYGDTLKKIDFAFNIRYYEILNKHLPPQQEAQERAALLIELETEISVKLPGSKKLITTTLFKPHQGKQEYNLHLDYGPGYQFISASKNPNPYVACKNCGLSFNKIKERQVYCNINCKEEAKRKQAAIRVKKYRLKHPPEKFGKSLNYTKSCEFCGSVFHSKRRDAKVCPTGPCRMRKNRSERLHQERVHCICNISALNLLDNT